MSCSSNSNRSSEDEGKRNGDDQVELPRKPLDYLFEKELIDKQNKRTHIMDTFGPSKNTQHLPTKFYARHDQHVPNNTSAFLSCVYGATHKNDTEANMYGWMPEIVNKTKLLKELNFVNAPKQKCCLTIFGEKLESDRANARPAFTGLRFFLQ